MKRIKDHFEFFDHEEAATHIKERNGETKIGEKLSYLRSFDELEQVRAQYILIGVPEDIGVQANHGKSGAGKLWSEFLSAFLNLQENRYLSGEDVMIAGRLNTEQLTDQARESIDEFKDQLGRLSVFVETLDDWLSQIIKKVKKAGKTPIVIGGGHNNAFGMMKGVSHAKNKPVNVFNLDAHTDLRWLDYRHSGNGFSYAIDQGFLDRYTIFGLDKAYTPEYIYEYMERTESVRCVFADEIYPLSNLDIMNKASSELDVLGEFGLEIDMDCVQSQPASALNPLGFSPQQLYAILMKVPKDQLEYVHCCEAIKRKDFPSGKLVANLIFSILQAN